VDSGQRNYAGICSPSSDSVTLIHFKVVIEQLPENYPLITVHCTLSLYETRHPCSDSFPLQNLEPGKVSTFTYPCPPTGIINDTSNVRAFIRLEAAY